MDEKIHGYGREDLMAMNVSGLRAVLHERTHHTIEVFLYRILKGNRTAPDLREPLPHHPRMAR